MLARDKGRWGNTQENAYAMEALVNYYRAYEAETPNFTAVVKLGETGADARAVPGTVHRRAEAAAADGADSWRQRRRGRTSR